LIQSATAFQSHKEKQRTQTKDPPAFNNNNNNNINYNNIKKRASSRE
jgi:hypothetical protein